MNLIFINAALMAGTGLIAYYVGKRSSKNKTNGFFRELAIIKDSEIAHEKELNELTGKFIYLVSDAMHNFNIGEEDGNTPDPKQNEKLRVLFRLMRYIHASSANPNIFFDEIHRMVDIPEPLVKEIRDYWQSADKLEKKRIESNIVLLGLVQVEHYLYGGQPNERNYPKTFDEFKNHIYLIKSKTPGGN